MAGSSVALNVYLGESKPAWLAYCAARSLKPGAAIKAAVDAELARAVEGRSDVPLVVKDESPDNRPKVQFQLRLTPSERQAIDARADIENCSPQVWAVNAIRGVLTKQPQVSMHEFEVLGESNHQLLAIAQSLRRIAKHLDQGHAESLTIERVAALARIIDQHTRQVSKVLGASLERWTLTTAE